MHNFTTVQLQEVELKRSKHTASCISRREGGTNVWKETGHTFISSSNIVEDAMH